VPDRGFDDPEALSGEDGVEGSAELRVGSRMRNLTAFVCSAGSMQMLRACWVTLTGDPVSNPEVAFSFDRARMTAVVPAGIAVGRGDYVARSSAWRPGRDTSATR
jgi:hypothetical protein